jgi:hypothetical protein
MKHSESGNSTNQCEFVEKLLKEASSDTEREEILRTIGEIDELERSISQKKYREIPKSLDNLVFTV